MYVRNREKALNVNLDIVIYAIQGKLFISAWSAEPASGKTTRPPSILFALFIIIHTGGEANLLDELLKLLFSPVLKTRSILPTKPAEILPLAFDLQPPLSVGCYSIILSQDLPKRRQEAQNQHNNGENDDAETQISRITFITNKSSLRKNTEVYCLVINHPQESKQAEILKRREPPREKGMARKLGITWYIDQIDWKCASEGEN